MRTSLSDRIFFVRMQTIYASDFNTFEKIKEKAPQGVPSIEQYTRTDRKRTESVLHSLSSFLDKHCICGHKCSIKLEVIADRVSVILLQATVILLPMAAVILYSPLKLA